MRNSINNYIDILKKLKEDNIKSISLYFKNNTNEYQSLRTLISKIRKKSNLTEDEQTLLSLYNSIKENSVKEVETDDRARAWEERDENNHIQYYCFEIYKRNKAPLIGKFNRAEMESIYRLYSYYGSSLTQRQVSRLFPEYSLVDFKRILRCFNITKAVSPFPKHYLEEKTNEELEEIHLRNKENDFLRRIEQNRLKDTETLLNKYAQENYDLKEQLKHINKINITINDNKLVKFPSVIHTNIDTDLILHLADLHVGARVDGILFNNEWNNQELNRRLDSLVQQISNLGKFNNIIINLLGDHLDGMDSMTCSRTHVLPQNMNNMEQVNNFVNAIVRFIKNIHNSDLCNKLSVYCVKCGNHAGDFEYAANLALMSTINAVFGESVSTTLFNKFMGYYEFKNHCYILCHGKNNTEMKRPLPLNLTDAVKIKLYEFIEENGINNPFIHFIKGDLHTENLNSCEKLDYRNVLSLFGSSDYSFLNYNRNQYGVSYDMFIKDTLLRGAFESL